MSKLFDLGGKTAVITGGSRGLGLTIANAYADHGANVVIASRKADACEAVARDIAARTGVRTLGLACHVGRWQDCDALVERCWSEFGRVDVLVNNAGMSPLYPSLEAVSEELWDKVMAVNLKGPFRLSALCARRMADAGGGSIISISSVAALNPQIGELPYAMAKIALHAMTEGIAHSYRGKVRANVIAPGAFATDISRSWPDSLRNAIRTMVPMGRAGEAHEIAGAAVYLASDAASYTSGSVLKVDGGIAYG